MRFNEEIFLYRKTSEGDNVFALFHLVGSFVQNSDDNSLQHVVNVFYGDIVFGIYHTIYHGRPFPFF